jgi:hypothetical protein
VTFSDLSTDRSVIIKLDNQNQASIKEFISNLFFGSDMVAQAKGLSSEELTAQAATPVVVTPTEAPTALPALDPIKIGNESIQPTTIVGYEAFGPKGELLATQDIYGNWIKVDREVAIPMATAEDWTNVNARLGTDFVINADGVIPGVDGVTVNKENGEITFSFNGKGPERYSIVNVKVQEINGVKRLLVAGYAWNGETKSWEVFNPGFPEESPEAQVGWFNEADVPNGNWLRWDQRAKQDLAIKAGFVKPDGTADVKAFMADIFKNAYVPTEWDVLTVEQNNADFDYDGKNDNIKFNRLWWKSDRPFPENNVGGVLIMTDLKKNEIPVQSGLTFSLLIDSKTGNKNVLISSDILNGDAEKTVTTAATLVDLKTFWTERKSDVLFERLKAAFGLSKYPKWTEAYMIAPVTSVFPGASAVFLSPELNALGQSQGSEIEGMISGANISPQISLRVVPGVLIGPNIVLSRK